MKFVCTCGEVIVDQTDFLSDKAHLIADQDWEDHCGELEAGRIPNVRLARSCYQCAHCGRLWIDDAQQKLQSFLPESLSGHRILGLSLGKEWRSPMAGQWTDKPFAGSPRGTLWSDAAPGFHQDFDDWAELQRAYHALFSTLLHQGLVRSAFLSKNGEMLHQWTHEEPSTSASQSSLSHWWRRWWKSPTR